MGNEGPLWQTLKTLGHSDDKTLAQRAVQDEPLARRALLDRYLPLIYSVCRRMNVAPQEVDDVCQEAVIKVLQQLASFRGESKLSTWIFTLTRRTVLDYFRSPRHREIAVDWSAAEHADALPLINDGHDERRDADKLTVALAKMSEPMRTVALRFYLADDSVGEIARELNLPEGTVKTHLFRARAQLRDQIGV